MKVIGFKATKTDLTCRGFQYKLGEQVIYQGMIQMCKSGLHFCEELVDCLRYYEPHDRFFKVEAHEVSDETHFDTKRVARYITLTEEVKLPWDDPEFQKRAIDIWGGYIIHMPTASDELKIIAVRKTPGTFDYIKNPSEAVKEAYEIQLEKDRWKI